MTFDSVRKWIELKIKKRSVLYIPGPCLSSFLVVKPSKTTSFPIKTRVMWVPGTPIMGISMMTSQSLNVTQIKSLRISPSILAYVYTYIWSNYSDLTRPHTKWWFSKGNPLISGKPRLVKYYNLARYIKTYIYILEVVATIVRMVVPFGWWHMGKLPQKTLFLFYFFWELLFPFFRTSPYRLMTVPLWSSNAIFWSRKQEPWEKRHLLTKKYP